MEYSNKKTESKKTPAILLTGSDGSKIVISLKQYKSMKKSGIIK